MPCVLAIAAHPDDIEFLMAGTLIRLIAAGYEVHYMNLANGCCGSLDYDAATTAAVRLTEARSAAEFIGAKFYPPICRDMEIFYEKSTLAKVSAVLRQAAPDILLTHSPLDYMEDHTNTCRLAVGAAFCRGMPNFPVDPPTPPIQKPIAVYHAQPYFHRDQLRQIIKPEFFVDVTAVIDQKIEMLAKHASQKRWLDQSQGHNSYLETLRGLDAECGGWSGKFRYAEGWRRHSHLGFASVDFDPLREILPEHLISSN